MADVSDRKPNDFTPVMASMELADYVMCITDNPKSFPTFKVSAKKNSDGSITNEIVMLDDSLINKVRDQSYQIYMMASRANRINLRYQPYRKQERLNRQLEAISLCEDHLCTIQLCRKHFHLSAKRIKYWGTLTIKARNAIEKWHESDVSRYKNV